MRSSCGNIVTANQFYSITKLNPIFGVEVHGVDLSQRHDLISNPSFIEQIKQDLQQHRILLFRNQNLSGIAQVNLSEKLGLVESTFYKHPRSPHPDIFRVSNDEREGCTNVGRSGWHVDGTFMATPFMYQTMYFPSVPTNGGDTYFIPLREFYDNAPPTLKKKWDRLWMMTGQRHSPVHPVVYKHPFRGDTTMVFHCGRPFVKGWIEEVDDTAEKQGFEIDKCRDHPRHIIENGLFHQDSHLIQSEITKEIESQMKENNLGIKMHWQKGDFTINDNLGLAHYASPSTQYHHNDVGLRILHRTTIIGGNNTVPQKTDGRKSFTF